ncbi:MAG: hypothetical protein AAGF23_24495, partial [Acidobacteriota bacterium]
MRGAANVSPSPLRRQRHSGVGLLAVACLVGASFASVASAQTDPGAIGPLDVTRTTYDDGDTAFTTPDFPGDIEVRASVHYPTDLASDYPLVLFLHGRHPTCFAGNEAFLVWPCPEGQDEIPSYEGYDFMASVLASHGYIVVSIGANGINALDNTTSDAGMLARAQLIRFHLEKWQVWNETGAEPFADLFVDKVDLDRIGLMGHSRGGEGAMLHVLQNSVDPMPFNIRGVLTLAPTDFFRLVVNDVNIGILLTDCDGDVNNLQGVRFYDDARYNQPRDIAFKHSFLILGGNHNYFNTVWTPSIFLPGSFDDAVFTFEPTCSSVGDYRLTEDEQQGVTLAYTSAFFRLYVGEEGEFETLLTDGPPPPSALDATVFPSYHAPDLPGLRLDINRFLEADDLTTNALGGTVSQVGLAPADLCGGQAPQASQCLPGQPSARQPHNPPDPAPRGLSQLELGWTSLSASLVHELPEGQRNVVNYDTLQFRTTLDFTSAANIEGEAQDFSVRLVDGSGASATVEVSSFSDALFFPGGSGLFSTLPKLVLNTVRIPVDAFVGVDRQDIARIELLFDQNPTGEILVTDLAFANLPSTLIFADGFETGDTVRWS